MVSSLSPILKPGLKLIGAKTKIRQRLYDLFPTNYDTYMEPFLGTGGVLIGSPKKGQEYAFDINPHVINYYQVLKDYPKEFWKLLCNMLIVKANDKDDFLWHRTCATECVNDIERAVSFYIVTKTCMNGIWRLNKNGKCNSSYCGTFKGRGFFTEEWFCRIVERVKHVVFDVQDYVDVIKPIYGNETFIFVDPPYRACKTTYNGISFSDADHLRLASLLSRQTCKWMVTINDDEFTRTIYKDYNIYSHDVIYSCSQTNAGRGKKPELIITNY